MGGILETVVTGLPAGIGEPWFDSVESEIGPPDVCHPRLSRALSLARALPLPPCAAARQTTRLRCADGKVATATNKNGGINGGITNGMPIVFRTVLKAHAQHL